MKVTSWNLLHGMTIPPKSGDDFAGLAAAAADLGSDVIAIQEVDHGLARSNYALQTRDIAIAMGAKNWAFAPAIIGSPEGKWEKAGNDIATNIESASVIDSGSYGIGIVSTVSVIKWHRLNLGRSIVGMPLLIPDTETGKAKAIYIKDEPRLAIAAELENGWTVINTHLSFVPGVNVFQLAKLKKWADSFGEKILLLGDFNLPGSIPAMGSKWQSLILQNTYPSWEPKIQFDYILSKGVALKDVIQVPTTKSSISDHLPLSIVIPN
jgi:endonuclease/exonuclease/phosphatase family metal-dependent hydrolase